MAKGAKSMNWILKIILVLIWDLYGLIRRLENKSIVIKLLGIIFFIFGGFGIIWLIDLITVLIKKDVTVLA